MSSDVRHPEPRPPTPRRELVVLWASDVVACLYLLWLFGMHWGNSVTFAHLYDGLGAEPPWATRLVIQQGAWLFPALFCVFVLAVVGKEPFVRDKRLSVMITFFVTLVAQFVAQAAVVAYYLPLFDLIRKLG
jgi:hypothetical protein